MNGVIGMTGLLLDTALDAEQREYTETIRRSGDALLTLINDILDVSKIEAGRLALETIDFDLRTTVEDVLELLAESAHRKGVELASLVRAGVPTPVSGDPGRLRQLLVNLVGNAVKFTHTGEVVGGVSLDTETAHDAVIHFTVTDTGIGIAPASVQQLFQSFSQADGSTTRQYGGSGLGLAISKKLAEMMGGHIGVESELGRGSTFWFTVRLMKQPVTSDAAVFDVTQLHCVRVLCVADNVTSRLSLEQQLTAWGMQVDCVEDDRSALAKMRTAHQEGHPYALGILNKHMSGMDGLVLAQAIKADPILASVSLVLLRSIGHRGEGAEARDAGIAAYLTKPIRQAHLHECLMTILGGTSIHPPAPMITRHSLAEARQQLRARVLVAEDNIVNQKVAVSMLEKLGCRVDVVANGREAVNALTHTAYDLVFMDCQMPEMDGYAATAAIRAYEAASGDRTPIIAMTAHAIQGNSDACLAAGMDDYVSKPVYREDLLAMLQKWIAPSKSDTSSDTPVGAMPS